MSITVPLTGFGTFGASAHDLAGYEYRGGNITGCVVIDTTIPFSHGDMFTVKIRGYNYDAAGSYEVLVSGYAHAGGPSFTNCAYMCSGRHVIARLMRKISTGTISIALFETTTVLSYPQIYVSELTTGFSGAGTPFNPAYAAGWTVTAGVQSLAAYDLQTTLTRQDNVSGLWERGRTTRVGEWESPTWNNAWLTSAGSLSSIDCVTYRYSVVGKNVTLLFWINATVTGGTYYLNLRTPNGWSIVGSVLNTYSTKENGSAWHAGHVYAMDSMTSIYLSQFATTPNYTGACAWAGQITFAIY